MATTQTRGQLEAKRDTLLRKLDDPGIDLSIVAAELERGMLADGLELMKLLPESNSRDHKIATQLLKIAQAQHRIERLQDRKRDPRVLADIEAVEDQIAMLGGSPLPVTVDAPEHWSVTMRRDMDTRAARSTARGPLRVSPAVFMLCTAVLTIIIMIAAMA